MTTRPQNWRKDLIQLEVEKPTIEIKLTEKELNSLIGLIEVDEEILKQSVEEDESKGLEPSEYCTTLLNLLTRLQELRGDFWLKNIFKFRQFRVYFSVEIWYNNNVRKNK